MAGWAHWGDTLPMAQVPGPLASAPLELIELTVVLRPRPDVGLPDPAVLGATPIAAREHLEGGRLADLRSAHPAELEAVAAWATREGLEVREASAARRVLRLAGSPERLAALFSLTIDAPEGAPVVLRGTPRLPGDLHRAIVAVLGTDPRPWARPHFRPLPLPDPSVPLAQAAPLSYSPVTLGELYQFPPSAPGSAGCVGLLELGGGYDPASVRAYFSSLGVAAPEVVPVVVAGGADRPTGDPQGPDGEVTLDIEVAGALAPGARLAVYFGPNTDQGFLAAIQAAIHDQVNQPSILSISWGGPEADWPPATRAAFEHAFEDAALAGITVCVAAGDSGSSDGVPGGLAHVDYPAASPLVLACGGTRLTASAGFVVSEVVWNDQPLGGATGGGVSAAFPLPSWQGQAGVPPSVNPGHHPGRGLPDVAGDADPETGYRVLVDGTAAVYGGTSAVAPLWAALLLRCSAALGRRIGYVNPLLYQSLAGQQTFRDTVSGSNGAYSAAVGWDPCTGWGSPLGSRLLAALRG